MIASSAPKQIPVGLGAVIDPVTKAFSYPSWCSWAPFSEFFDSCTPATPAQIAASAAADLTGAAATPANQQAVTGTVYQTIANDCSGSNTADDQASCLAYNFSIAHPTLAALLGTSTTAQTVGNLLATHGITLLVVGGVAVIYFSQRNK